MIDKLYDWDDLDVVKERLNEIIDKING